MGTKKLLKIVIVNKVVFWYIDKVLCLKKWGNLKRRE